MLRKNQLKSGLVFSSIVLLTACGGGGSSSNETNTNTPPDSSTKECSVLQYLEDKQCRDKLTQSIELPTIPSMKVGDKFTLPNLNSKVGLPLQFSTLTSQICSINATGQIEALKAGDCVLKLSQTGNNKYLPALETEIKFKIAASNNNTGSDVVAADVGKCEAGKLSPQHKTAALNTLNEIRALHNLKPVSYDESSENEAMQAALVIVANNEITHQPQSNAQCYSAAALKGSQTSNLDYFYSTQPTTVDLNRALVNMMTEKYSDSIGHRRWLLNPFLTQVSFGAVVNSKGVGQYQYSSASAVKVIYDFNQASTSNLGVIAYPFGNYPSKYFDKTVPLSISIFRDQQDYWKNKEVDLSAASIKVIDRQTQVMQSISEVNFDHQHSGLANSIQFKFAALQYGRTYDVQLNNVKIEGVVNNYNYWFKVTE